MNSRQLTLTVRSAGQATEIAHLDLVGLHHAENLIAERTLTFGT
jgi:hypothetical protein